jgi:hypothetical protein
MGDLDRLPGQLMVEDFRQGYPRFCALIDSHPAWNVFRRFSKLRARIILRKQDSLLALEQQLEAVDQQEATPLFLASNRLDGNTERKDILNNIEKGLRDYGPLSPARSSISDIFLDNLIKAYSRILNARSADSRDVFSLQNWVAGNRCLARTDYAYLSRKDLFSVVKEDGALVRVKSLVEDIMIQYFLTIYKVCYTPCVVPYVLKQRSAVTPSNHKTRTSLYHLELGSDAWPVS